MRGVANGSLLVLMFASGCSWIYDADALRGRDGDAGVISDGAPPPDVNPNALRIDGIEPAELYEGQGTGRAVPIVVSGSDIAQNARITIANAEALGLVVGETVVARDGTMAATTVSIPVLEELPASDARTLVVTIEQGPTLASTDLVVRGLDELVVDGKVGPVAARYSRIRIAGDTQVDGEVPVRLVATAEIIVAAVLAVNGIDGGKPGAGGCAGGAREQPGGCGIGGGTAGESDALDNGTGGGGGGFAAPGSGGSGGRGAGTGGMTTGNEMLTPLIVDPNVAGNRGNGGGGGGDGLLGGEGGSGGGGGGVIELTSEGVLRCIGRGHLEANGGNGTPASGGGGGGGSGGAILIRAAQGIESDCPAALATALPGAGGGTGNNAGGSGSVGRIRIDTPAAEIKELETAPAAHRGPMLVELPAITRDSPLELALQGEGGRTYGVRVNNTNLAPVIANEDGAATIDVSLEPGSNRICLLVAEDANFSLAEAVNCATVAFLP